MKLCMVPSHLTVINIRGNILKATVKGIMKDSNKFLIIKFIKFTNICGRIE